MLRRRAGDVSRQTTGLKLDYASYASVLLEFAAEQGYGLEMRSAHTKRRPAKASQAGREAGYQRKQRWKAKPGNRYTAKELRLMSESLGRIRILQPEFHLMKLD